MTERDAGVDEISATEATRWSRQSIYRIPASLKAQNPRAYNPETVSIGPYHHGQENLHAMETHKLRARHNFLNRSGKSLEFLYRELSPSVQVLKDAYDQLDEGQWRGTEIFLDLMITDGCFVLELLRPIPKRTDQASNFGYPANDPIFSKEGHLKNGQYLKRDMLMLENQIPMLVLQRLMTFDPCEKSSNELTRRILEFFYQDVPQDTTKLDELSKCLHVLDLYRQSLVLHRGEVTKLTTHEINSDDIIRSATELNEAGITITKSKTKSLRDISFNQSWCCRGVLKLPLIMVDDKFESSYLNLIAYERLHMRAGNEVTSFIFFMDNIIDSVQDVSLLHSSSVIQNALGSDEAVAKLFNSLSSDSVLDPDSELGVVHKQVASYCQTRCNRWRAYCCHHYCANPLVAITVVAAIFIFALTVLQSTYSALEYHKPSSK